MEKYLSAVSEMYSQFKQKEAHQMEKYIGRYVVYLGYKEEVVGYTTWPDGSFSLIVDCSSSGGWSDLGPDDVVFKECKSYWYVGVSNLID